MGMDDYMQAYRDGYNDGYKNGMEACQDEMRQLRDVLNAILSAGEAPEHDTNDGNRG